MQPDSVYGKWRQRRRCTGSGSARPTAARAGRRCSRSTTGVAPRREPPLLAVAMRRDPVPSDPAVHERPLLAPGLGDARDVAKEERRAGLDHVAVGEEGAALDGRAVCARAVLRVEILDGPQRLARARQARVLAGHAPVRHLERERAVAAVDGARGRALSDRKIHSRAGPQAYAGARSLRPSRRLAPASRKPARERT